MQDQKLRDKANDQREKFFQIFKDLNFNISFADAQILMPKFGPSIKSLLTNKDKLCELVRTPLNEDYSAVLLKKLPKKLGDPDKFLIPCDFPEKAECLALADLGVWPNKLSLPELTPTLMALELADRSISRPIGVDEDVYVKVGRFHFSADFVVVDFDADPRVPLILMRYFLKTGRDLIDVFEGELTLRVGKEAITFNLDQTSRYSANYNDMTNSCQFHGLPGDDANKHLDKFLHVTQSIKVNGVTDDALRLYLFPHSLTHHATAWFDCLPKHSINTFEQMAKMFLGKYFPPSMVAKLRNEITNFRQRPDESLFKAWERYKLSIDRSQRSESSSSITFSFDTNIAALKAEMAEINKNLMRVLQPPLAKPRTYMLREPVKANDAILKNMQTNMTSLTNSNIELKNMFGQFMNMNTALSSGSRTLPGNTITNPKEELKGITTRSGTAYQGPTIPTTSSSLLSVVERETEATNDMMHPANNGSTKDVQPLVVQTESLILNSEPVVAPIIEPIVAPKDSKARLLRWVLLLQEFTFKVINTKGAENLATDHLSQLENLHQNVLDPKEINESFPLETLNLVSSRGNSSASWKPLIFLRLATMDPPGDIMAQTTQPRSIKGRFRKEMRCRKISSKFAKFLAFGALTLWGRSRLLEGTNTYSFGTPEPSSVIEKRTSAMTSLQRKVQLNELNELRDQAYENSLIYKEKTKRLHDSKIKDRVFNIGDRVLLFNSRLKIFSGKLKSHWSGQFTISHVFPYGTVELSPLDGPNFKVNGRRLKHYFGEDIPTMVVPGLQTFLKDK
nr:reverse transcriptase domain-containing protein [Tanacetum cinerariifolium]